MEKSNKLDFGGQHIYVGMDVHKKSWSVSIHTEQFEHKTFTQPPEIEKLTYYLQRTFPELRIADGKRVMFKLKRFDRSYHFVSITL
jgi:hypothetical protein